MAEAIIERRGGYYHFMLLDGPDDNVRIEIDDDLGYPSEEQCRAVWAHHFPTIPTASARGCLGAMSLDSQFSDRPEGRSTDSERQVKWLQPALSDESARTSSFPNQSLVGVSTSDTE
jgi:hypothetical protein